MSKNKSQASTSNQEKTAMRQIREELGMTQVEFAVAIGMSYITISRCERGVREPVFTMLQMKKLCELTGKHPSQFPDYLGQAPEEVSQPKK